MTIKTKIVKEWHSESQSEQKRVYLLGNLLAQVIIRLLKGGLLLDAVLLGGLRDAAGADRGHRGRLPRAAASADPRVG